MRTRLLEEMGAPYFTVKSAGKPHSGGGQGPLWSSTLRWMTAKWNKTDLRIFQAIVEPLCCNNEETNVRQETD